MKLNTHYKQTILGDKMKVNQLLFMVIGAVVLALMTAVAINIFIDEADITAPQNLPAVIISQPEWGQLVGHATAQRLDNGERIKVSFSNKQIHLGSKVKLTMTDPAVSLYPIAELAPTGN